MKRPLAAVALIVLTWSNATALQCAASAPDGAADARAGTHAHAGHAHASAPNGHPKAHEHGDADDAGQEKSIDCGVMMSCGAVLAAPAHPVVARSEHLERQDVPVLATPSTADLGRDPPPPRRSA